MPTCHLISNLEFAFNRHKNLHHLDDPRGKFVTTLKFVDLILENHFDEIDLLRSTLDNALGLAIYGLMVDADLSPITPGDMLQVFLGHLFPFIEKNPSVVIGEARSHTPAHQKFLEALQGSLVDDANLIVLILLQSTDLIIFNDLATLVLIHSLP